MEASNLIRALGQPADSSAIASVASSLSPAAPLSFAEKQLGAVRYLSLPSHGVSLQFEHPTQPACAHSDATWTCHAIDVYNDSYDQRWNVYAGLPLALIWRPASSTDADTLSNLTLTRETTGVQLVNALGEPQRKGGGEPLRGGGASGLGPGAWMEWKVMAIGAQQQAMPIVIMIELAGPHVRGANRWDKDRAGVARWGVCTFSLPSK